VAFDAAEDQPYYRQRAAARLAAAGKKVSAALPAVLAPGGHAGERLHAEKARALRGLGLLDEAAEEYREQAAGRPEDREALGEACHAFLDMERYDRALWLGKRLLLPLFLQERKLPVREYWQCLYPLGYPRDVNGRAREQALDPLLVTAVMREESGFGPGVVSRVGARGLMQVMPGTADRIAREQHLPAGAAALDAPEANVRFGVAHLAELARVYNGNLTLVLAGYNAGKQAVQRWLARGGFPDEEAFVEDIPYAETRNYVKRVLGSYHRYQQVYGGEPRAPSPEPRSAEPRATSREPR
jgi:soluble lytic murein transglycosylase-like protein